MDTKELQGVVGPRPAAYVKQLRLKGYEILTQRRGKIALYTLLGFTPQVEVTDEMKSAYYMTEHWRTMRSVRLNYDNFRCCICQANQLLQVHHWRYDLFDEDLMDLLTLCESCHERIHEYANVQVHFPHFVSPDIAQRLISGDQHSIQAATP